MADFDNDTPADVQLRRFAAGLRDGAVPVGDDARARVLAAVRAAATEDAAGVGRAAPHPGGALDWLLRRRHVVPSPLAGAALAASLVGLGVVGTWTLTRDSALGVQRPEVGPSPDGRAPSPVAIQFVLVAPRASSVELVGDFSDWRALPMRAAPQGGMWTVTVPLAPGRHTYSFVVDGTTWMTDPTAPLAPEDGFGSRNSVVMVGEASI